MSEGPLEIPKKSPAEHCMVAIKAIIAGLPFPGAGTVATLIDEYVPKSSQVALETFIRELDERLKTLKDRLDGETVKKDEFAELFKSCYIGVIKTTQKEKIKVFAAMFANSMLKDGDPDKASYSELDHFVRAMDSLSIGALRVMIKIYELCRGKQPATDFSNIDGRFPEMDAALVMALVEEIRSFYLVEVTVPSVKRENYANYSIRLTELGRKFVDRYAK